MSIPIWPTPVALPPKVRAVLYYVTALLGAGLGTTQTVYLAIGQAQPLWLTVAIIVFGGISAAFGLTAASNTPIKPAQDHQPGEGVG